MWYVNLIFRWLHILPAMAMVGGVIFMRLAYAPAIANLADDAREALQESVRKRWSVVVMASSGLLIITGIFNVWSVMSNAKVEGSYHGAIFVKILLALGIFFIASLLTGKSERAAGIRRNMKFWLNINLALAVIVVCLAGVLKMDPHAPRKPAETPVESTDK